MQKTAGPLSLFDRSCHYLFLFLMTACCSANLVYVLVLMPFSTN